jgi:hypothetical protein
VALGVAAVFLLGGLVTGFLTGMLGLGGGVVMVPIVYESYLHLGAAPKAAFVTAVASSLAVIVFTGGYAAWTHYREGRLDLRLILRMALGTVCGALLGAHLLMHADNRAVRFAFGIFLWMVAASMLLPRAARAHDASISLRAQLGLVLIGVFMGAAASLFGIGGAALVVPALILFFGISVHRAIAAASAMILVTAVCSSLNYVVTGWHDPAAPAHGIGWIDPVAVLLLLPGALFTTRLGIRIAQGYSGRRLQILLMLFQVGVGARFVLS